MLNAGGTTGDILPFYRIVAELPRHLQGFYYMNCVGNEEHHPMYYRMQSEIDKLSNTAGGSASKCYVILDRSEWLSKMRDAPQVDVVILGQGLALYGEASDDDDNRFAAELYRTLQKKQSLLIL
jgi:hypothetical protein